MDTEHRHELKTNELADWIVHVPRFFRENLRWIIGGSLILVAVLVFMFGRNIRANSFDYQLSQTTGQIEGLQRAQFAVIQNQMQDNPVVMDSLFQSANKLEISAQSSKYPSLAALALIKRGDALRMDLHYNGEDVEAAVVQSRLDAARKSYNDALTKAKGCPNEIELTALAQFGLAMISEEAGQFDQAKAAYKAIVDNAEFAITPVVRQARHRLAIMDEQKEQFTFVDAPKPAPQPTLTPGTPVPGQPTPVTPAPAPVSAPQPEAKPVEQPAAVPATTPVLAPAAQPEAKPADQPPATPAPAPLPQDKPAEQPAAVPVPAPVPAPAPTPATPQDTPKPQ